MRRKLIARVTRAYRLDDPFDERRGKRRRCHAQEVVARNGGVLRQRLAQRPHELREARDELGEERELMLGLLHEEALERGVDLHEEPLSGRLWLQNTHEGCAYFQY